MDSIFPHYNICSDCAVAMGAVFPEGNAVTCHEDTCPYCDKKKTLCAVTDWDWPKQGRKHVFD